MSEKKAYNYTPTYIERYIMLSPSNTLGLEKA